MFAVTGYNTDKLRNFLALSQVGETSTFTKNCVVIILLCSTCVTVGQEAKQINTDSLLYRSIGHYQEGNFETSLEFAEKGLELAPEYHDLRIFKIRNHQALGEANLAEKELLHLLKVASSYPGVLDLAYRQAYQYKGKEKRLTYLSRIMNRDDIERRFLFLYTETLVDLGRRKEAQGTIRQLESIDKLTGKERYRLGRILDRTVKGTAGGDYQVVVFKDGYGNREPWHMGTVEYKHLVQRTAVLARLNYLVRHSSQGGLFEVEGYPVLNEDLYLHLNMGISDGSVFPNFKGSVSVYYNLPINLELEAGSRFLQYENDPAYLITGGAGTYLGLFYLNGRIILGPENEGLWAKNYQLNLRYYFKGNNNYFFSRLGQGFSPNELEILSQFREKTYKESRFLNVGIQFLVSYQHFFRIGLGVVKEDLTGTQDHLQLLSSFGYRIRL